MILFQRKGHEVKLNAPMEISWDEAHDNAMSFLRRQHQMGKKFKFKIEPTDIVGFKGVRFYMNKNELNN